MLGCGAFGKNVCDVRNPNIYEHGIFFAMLCEDDVHEEHCNILSCVEPRLQSAPQYFI